MCADMAKRFQPIQAIYGQRFKISDFEVICLVSIGILGPVIKSLIAGIAGDILVWLPRQQHSLSEHESVVPKSNVNFESLDTSFLPLCFLLYYSRVFLQDFSFYD